MLEGIMILAGAVVALCLLVAVWDGNRFRSEERRVGKECH